MDTIGHGSHVVTGPLEVPRIVQAVAEERTAGC
jgi:hypothetical protein